MGEGGTIDLTQGNQVVVDLLDTPPSFEPSTFGTASFEPSCTPHLGSSADDAERVSAWVDRMRQKRERDQAEILGHGAERATSAAYWSSDHVSGGDDPTDEPGVVADPSRRSRLLGELGLPGEATSEDIALAYRKLAKQHHPDRWAEADEATRQRNAEEMMRVNAVYRALRISGDVGPRGRASTPPAPPAPGPR
jgi:hypothetical protein